MANNILIRDTGKKDLDSVKLRRKVLGGKLDTPLLDKCEAAWLNLAPYRRTRERMLRFIYGDQWGDRIKVKGKWMTEREHLVRTGNVALQFNLIKKNVNSVAGGVIKDGREPVVTAVGAENRGFGDLMTACLQSNWYENKMSLIITNQVEEAMAGGLMAVREAYERRDGIPDSWSNNVDMNSFFFDGPMVDPRMDDMVMVGEAHEIPFNEVMEKFAFKPSDYKKLREWYPTADNPLETPDTVFTDDRRQEGRRSFLEPTDRQNCVVVEVWTKERKPRYHVFDPNEGEMYDIDADDRERINRLKELNEARLRAGRQAGWPDEEIPLIEWEEHWFVDTFWYGRFLTPNGNILWEGESPYPDRKHPYTILAIPYVNGRICGYISDLVDQNIAINRILTLDDFIRRAGVKGVSFIPEGLVPPGMSYDEFSEQWTSIDGIIYYKPKPNLPEPKVFYGNVGTINTAEVVNIMSQLMDSASPATGAYRGDTPHAGTSAALYNQQTQNAAIPLASLLDRLNFFIQRLSTKKLLLIAENYDVSRYVDIAGEAGLDTSGMDLTQAGDIRYKVKTRQGPSAEQSQQMLEEDLRYWMQMGALTFDDYLALSKRPYLSELRSRYEARMQEMAMQQQAAALQQGQQQQAQQ